MSKSPALMAARVVFTETAAAFLGALSHQAARGSQKLWRSAGEQQRADKHWPSVDFVAGPVDYEGLEAALEEVFEDALGQVPPSATPTGVTDADSSKVLRFPSQRDARSEHPAGQRGRFGSDPTTA